MLGSKSVRKEGSSVVRRPFWQDDGGDDNDGCF